MARMGNGDDAENGVDWKFVFKVAASIIATTLLIIGVLIKMGLDNIQSDLTTVKAITSKTAVEVARVDQKVTDHIEQSRPAPQHQLR